MRFHTVEETVETPRFTSDQITAIQCQKPVLGLTHSFYRYPARFSPQLARAVIEALTKPGDLVLDPFCGGATTLVEATAMGRRAIGVDISPLAIFLAKVKTRPLGSRSRSHIRSWAEASTDLTLRSPIESTKKQWRQLGYQKHLNSPNTWPIRKSLELLLGQLEKLPGKHLQEFARCAILRTGQWALDGRKRFPSANAFRIRFRKIVDEMLNGMADYAAATRQEGPTLGYPLCLHRSANELHMDDKLQDVGTPRLVLTSPPYPGVHVLYHRWQIGGGRETPAPFWIADELDDNGESHYTFGNRAYHDQGVYFDCLRDCFESICAFSTSETIFAQIVGFSEPQRQLRRYLETLSNLGFEEIIPIQAGHSKPRRIWREVPRRRWYAEQRRHLHSGREVLLFHRLTRHSA